MKALVLISLIVSVIISLGFSFSAQARDTVHRFSVQEFMDTQPAKSRLDPEIKFFFGTKTKPKGKVKTNYGEYMSNKKTNAFNKSDKQACHWAFLSALLTFQKRAKDMGGNAVINIRSYYKKKNVDSVETFECGAGTVIAGVTLVGDVVKLNK